ncbi:MAG: hypothetical protein Q8L15_00925 [Methylobacter sp.]|nr:hypothetical protein [Methylobacter sp.]
MSNNVTNAQADPMTINPGSIEILGGATGIATEAIASITYHKLVYTRVGEWVVADGVSLTATYPGGNNIILTTPQHFEIVYAH